MVKRGRFPSIRGVAKAAIISELTHVSIIRLVANSAGGGSALIGSVRVAVLTGNVEVLPS